MNDFNTYLTQLQNILKSFSSTDREEIIAEITSHIEDGLDDPTMGLSQKERIKKITSELGSPLELGNSFQESNWGNRWVNFLLALVPLLVIELIRFSTIVGLDLLSKTGPKSALLIPLFIITPIYIMMVFVGQYRRSPALILWWLSLTTVFFINAVFVGIFGEAPLWMLVIWVVCLVFGLGLLGYTLRQHRQNGLLLAFALIPITLQLANRWLGIFFVQTISPEQYGEYVWRVMWLNNLLFLCIIAFMFLFSQHRIRWLGLTAGSVIYFSTFLIIRQPLPAFTILILYGPLIFFPIILGLLIEYRHTYRNPLAST